MKDREPSSNPYRERSLSPEDYADIVEMLSWVNKVVERQYPNAPLLDPSQVKVVPNLAETERASAKRRLHPLFKEKVKGKIEFGPPEEISSWVDPGSNNIFFDGKNIDDLRTNKLVGYCGIGADLIEATVLLETKTLTLESKKATQTAIDMLTASYRMGLKGIVTEDDLKGAISYLNEKGSKVQIRGLALSLIVEDKLFLPQTGLNADATLLNYLTRPIRVDYIGVVSNEFKLPFNERAALEQLTESAVPPLVSLSQRDSRQMEKQLLADIDRRGFRGRKVLFRAYQSGEIGKKIVESLGA